MKDRLKKIKKMRMMGITVFCDWEKEIDWLIEQVDTHPATSGASTVGDLSRLRKAVGVLTAENEELRLRMRSVTSFIDGVLKA